MGSKPRTKPAILERWTEESDEFFESLEAGDFDRLEEVIARAEDLLRQMPATMKEVRKRLRAVARDHGEALRRIHMGEEEPRTAAAPEQRPATSPAVSEPARAPVQYTPSSEPGSLCVLDSNADESRMAVRENFVVALFFRRKLGASLAKGAGALLEEWLDVVGEDSLRFARIGASATSEKAMTSAILSRARKRFTRDATAGVEHHFMHLFGPQDQCPDFSFSSSIKTPEDRNMAWGRYFTTNVIELCFPVSFFAERGAANMVSLVARLAGRLPYDSGIAGWALHAPQDHRKRAGEFALRYPGYFLSDSYPAHRMGDRSVGAQWLTLVGPALRKELGEPDALGPEIEVHKSGKGLVIQAGPQPLAGRDGEDLEAYKKVARWLRPATHLVASGALWHYMESEQAQGWLQRYL